MDIASLPFNAALGITVDDDSIVLSPRPDHLNHIGTVHATVLFGIAESAAGFCLMRRFPELIEEYRGMLRGSTVKFRRPGSADSALRGRGTLDETAAAEFIDTLRAKGRATIDVAVSVTQGDDELLRGTFGWFAGK